MARFADLGEFMVPVRDQPIAVPSINVDRFYWSEDVPWEGSLPGELGMTVLPCSGEVADMLWEVLRYASIESFRLFNSQHQSLADVVLLI